MNPDPSTLARPTTAGHSSSSANRERVRSSSSGFAGVFFLIVLLVGAIAFFRAGQFMFAIPMAVIWFFCLKGLFTLQPNEAMALIFFGKYVGTVRAAGFHYTNPFNSKIKLSLRSRNFNSERLKVNDKRGNPIEIAIVVVWRIEDTAQALFDVDDYVSYVRIQSESAIRYLASEYAYDDGEENETTLRGGGELVSHSLQKELQERLNKAGVLVEEARITHLAYAAEIAQAMLRRQQAEAVIAARKKIVTGAVSMVEMALTELAEKQIVELDAERKAAMVSNLLVVLCAESEVTPVVNTGTLYH